jgi:fumarate reductase subunit C
MIETSLAKPFVRKVARASWYLHRRRDRMHMAQELSSLFIGGYALLLLWGIRALAAGPEAYQAFLTSLGSPLSLSLHWLVLAVTLFHTVSWFGVTPKAMPVQIGEKFLPGGIIVGGHYVVWTALSLFILFVAGVFNGG